MSPRPRKVDLKRADAMRAQLGAAGQGGTESDPTKTWLIDLGNTRLKWARDDALANDQVWALAHADAAEASALDVAFAAINAGDHAWIASAAATGCAGYARAHAKRLRRCADRLSRSVAARR
jgi:hypothetical protein